MNKLKNRSQLMVVLTSVMLALLILVGRVQADTMTNVMSGTGTTFTPESTGNVVFGSSGYYGINSYPKLKAITANNVSNGRITTKTTQVAITLTGTVTAKNNVSMNNFYFDMMQKDGTSLQSGSTTLFSGNSKTFSSSGTTQTITVDLTDLANDLPIYVGFRYNASSGGGDIAYQLGSFTNDATAAAALKPTIDSTAGSGKVSASDQKITGTGTNVGDKITSSAGGSTTVGSDKTYSLDLGSAIGSASSVTVTESNATGDKGTATADVVQKTLDLDSQSTSLDLSPDDASSLASMSDSEIVAWLAKQTTLGLSPSYSDGSSTSDVTYATDDSGIAAKIKALATGDSTTVSLYATDGTLKSSAKTITLTKQAGTLTFGTISSAIGFGDLEVPTKETIFKPTSSWDVSISDTRAAGSKWYVYATASAMTSAKHTLKGNLIYQDGSDQQSLTNTSTLIASGERNSGSNTTDVTSDWDNSTKGIFLDVFPGVYNGTYSGTVNWSLQDTPAE
ncbi:cell surface protein [Lactiplantibacillus daowaiensis]|uniref:Cell surface protein n=1 Tax=Lactiplantibacillus daowaiensis TaxID=2559918 RepID=A0ABW1S377_9LACO|nr:cell surface protein [Lactiplantibacillus daowaiensis]